MGTLEQMISGRGLTEEEYQEFKIDLATWFWGATVGVRLNSGFTKVTMDGAESRKVAVVMADEDGQAIGMVRVFPVKSPMGGEKMATFTTASYVAPQYRREGVLKGLLTEAQSVVEDLLPGGKFGLMMEALAFPDTQEYAGVRAGVARLLLDLGYTAVDEQGVFMKVVMGRGD